MPKATQSTQTDWITYRFLNSWNIDIDQHMHSMVLYITINDVKVKLEEYEQWHL